MVVIDASVLVSATFHRRGVPRRAVLQAIEIGHIALSEEVVAEWESVLSRPALARFISPSNRSELLGKLLSMAVWFAAAERVDDCRDIKDNKYLELALAAGASTIVSGDADLLVLDPWRGVRVLSPGVYLSQADGGV